MRNEFAEIISGWAIVDDVEALGECIERTAEWAKANGPLQQDEIETVQLMIRTQVAKGIRRGDFEPYIPADTDPDDVLNFDLEAKR